MSLHESPTPATEQKRLFEQLLDETKQSPDISRESGLRFGDVAQICEEVGFASKDLLAQLTTRTKLTELQVRISSLHRWEVQTALIGLADANAAWQKALEQDCEQIEADYPHNEPKDPAIELITSTVPEGIWKQQHGNYSWTELSAVLSKIPGLNSEELQAQFVREQFRDQRPPQNRSYSKGYIRTIVNYALLSNSAAAKRDASNEPDFSDAEQAYEDWHGGTDYIDRVLCDLLPGGSAQRATGYSLAESQEAFDAFKRYTTQ